MLRKFHHAECEVDEHTCSCDSVRWIESKRSKWIHLPTGSEVRELGGFSIVYADPAWQYRQGGRGAAENHYQTMPIEEICALPVSELAAPDAVLFLWGTYALTPEAMRVIDAWGFKFKTLAFDWVKLTVTGKEHFGLGQWTRGNPEPCWLGVRGDPPRRISAAVRQLVQTETEVISAPVGRHSAKPPIVRERIHQLMGAELSSVELFARERAEGWECWGNQVNETVRLAPST